uniref:Sterol carrier protein 2 n=1 Tax=Ciona intestinalis TaxID=7719 RepID=F7A5Y1_CIOIN
IYRMGRNVYVIGVGMTKFEKPGRRENFDYPDMAKEAGLKALADAGISYHQVEQAAVGYCYGDSTCGQRALYQLGMTGIPIYNVNNNCSTGSTALFMAKQFIEGGLAECTMALGFEKMERGSLKDHWNDRTPPGLHHGNLVKEIGVVHKAPITPQLFGNAGLEHMKKYGTKPEHFAKIGWKNHKHSTNNPYSQFQKEYSFESVLNGKRIYDYLTLLQCCPTSDGSGCAILASADFVRKHGLEHQAVEIVAQEMATDLPSTFAEKSSIKLVGFDMTKRAVDKIYEKTGLRASDAQVVELHDCFSANELITYEALGLCGVAKPPFLFNQSETYSSDKLIGIILVVAHSFLAAGLAQCSELIWQLRGEAGKRQVKGATLALQHNLGIGGAVVVTMYKLGFPEPIKGQLVARATASVSDADGMKTTPVFKEIQKAIEADGASYIEKIKGIIAFKIKPSNSSKGGVWVINAKTGKGSVEFNSTVKPDCTITMTDDDMYDLMMGKLNPNSAFFSGKLKISGNMGLAMKIQNIMPAQPKL